MEIPADEAPPLGAVDHFTPSQRRRAVIAATMGNGLEFYDFITFAFFAIQIGNTFFPSQNHYLSLMGSLATFGAGFITRPLGAHILGGYADRRGRKPAMLISMSLMGLGIVLLCVTPGYASIGIAAPVIAVCARLIQGFALGGEVGSATVYMMESARPERRAFTVAWQGASQNVAATIGPAVGLALSLALSASELSAHERALIDFEREWWQLGTRKDVGIRNRFDMSASTYYRALHGLVDRSEAMQYSGRSVTEAWRCPFHTTPTHDSAKD